MSRSLFIGLAAIAGVAVAPMAMADEGAIVVSSPRVQDGGAKGANPGLEVVSQVAVPTHDLDLRTDYGRSVLDHRVEFAARQVCARLDEATPASGIDTPQETRDCRIEVRKSAQAQVRAAHLAAG